MRIMQWAKDGGPKSHVHAFYIVEIKSLFSTIVLRFSPGTREAYHNHAFNAVSWLLRGTLGEWIDNAVGYNVYRPSWKPIVTPWSRFHQVYSVGTSWAISFRGPWSHTWKERDEEDRLLTLAHGRKVI